MNKQILLGKISQSLLDEAGKEAYDYSVNIFTIIQKDNHVNTSSLGSGTLVFINGKHAILTAFHVVDSRQFKESIKIGLNIRNDRHHYSLFSSQLQVIPIAKSISKSKGPDLALIYLPDDNIGILKANRSFWNISKFKNILEKHPLDYKCGIFILFGTPREQI